MHAPVAPESLINVLGVVYVHKKTSDGGDLYLTKFGLAHADLLEVANWYDRAWFASRSERLEGTSAVYRVPTKEINGRRLDLVVKNCRVGEHVPLETQTLLEFINAEFNSPWEEFSLVMEMRDGKHGPADLAIETQEPLAIYVPPEKMQLWQSGRSRQKINRIRARHSGIDLDILRQYKLVYRWIEGRDTVQTLQSLGYKGKRLDRELEPLTLKVIADMEVKGFAVVDMKPAHIIVDDNAPPVVELPGDEAESRGKAESLRRLIDEGRYSVVDYELLMRTPAHEEEVTNSRRHSYLDDQRDRFRATPLPSHLKSAEILGVPYVFGHAESTGGSLWVVGRNPRLFDYFLPERWRRTHSWLLSKNNEVFYTFTKDHVHIVWKTSRVGERPSIDHGDPNASLIADRGFNSPFEEFAIAHYLSTHGVPTVYVRAIYMTGSRKQEKSVDFTRYESHSPYLDPEGQRILREDRNYITLRGYYNGSDRWLAEEDGKYLRPVDLQSAAAGGLITPIEYEWVFDATRQRLKNVGYDGSLLEGNDILLTKTQDGSLSMDSEGLPEARICNFEFIRRL